MNKIFFGLIIFFNFYFKFASVKSYNPIYSVGYAALSILRWEEIKNINILIQQLFCLKIYKLINLMCLKFHYLFPLCKELVPN